MSKGYKNGELFGFGVICATIFCALFPAKKGTKNMKPARLRFMARKRRFIFCGNAAKCFMRRKPRFIYHISPLALTDLARRSPQGEDG